MSRKLLIATLLTAAVLVITLLGFYWATFGFPLSHEQPVWGAFGDYFGGILNPIFALFAFAAVLWSLHLQMNQLQEISNDKVESEILQVIKDIDTRIAFLIDFGSTEFSLRQMISEAQRYPKRVNRSEVYSRFLRRLKEPGSDAEATVSNLIKLCIDMYRFLQKYPNSKSGTITPLVEYYINKTSYLIPVLEEAQSMPSEVTAYFKSKSAC